MTAVVTPCEDSPEDWFIERDGKQYKWEDDLEPEELKQALIRRRKARDACFTECPVRLRCLSLSLTNEEDHGTWGGYYPEQRREILRLQKLRREE